MKKLFTFAVLATVACTAILSSCKTEDPVPVVSITTQPTAPTALTEGSITGSLTVAATVTEDVTLTYQWYSNTSASNTGGTEISGATDKTSALPTDLAAGTYYYFCEVGAEGAKVVRTSAVTVTVDAKPAPVITITITTQPTAPATLTEGSIPEDTELTVEATATDGTTLKYQWYTSTTESNEDGTAIKDATGASYTLLTDLKEGTYYYYCEITAEGTDAVQTNPVKVTITAATEEDEPLEVADNAKYDIPAMTVGTKIANIDLSDAITGGTAPYSFSATGLPAGITISSAGVISGTPTGAVAAGKATVTIKDSSSPAKSVTVTIDFGAVKTETPPTPPPYVAVTNITSVPTAATTGVALTLIGTVVPTNATNKTIVWSISDAGTTNATISGGKLTATAAGTVKIKATIANGATASTPYTKDFDIVVSAPVITISTQPTETTELTQGNITGSLSVAATATPTVPLSYQWYSNTSANNSGGAEISNATSASYTIPTTLTVDGGPDYFYYCVVSATGATPVTSAVAKVTVAHSYSISVSPTTPLQFGSVEAGYATAPTAQTVTITNTGTGVITLTQPTAMNYTIGALTETELAAGATANFTVQPKTGLSADTYIATIGIVASNIMTPTQITAQFTVTPPPTPVSAAAIAGVTSPVANTTPSTAITNGTGFTASLAWDGAPVTFDYSTAYTATVTLTAAEGYTFNGGFGDTAAIAGFKVNGNAPEWISNNGTTLVFKVTFPQTATPTLVLAAAIAGVTSPVANATPSTAITNGTGFTASLAWNSNPATFGYETTYTATITLTAAEGYTFNGGFANTAAIAGFTVNGNIPTLINNNGSTLVFSVTFPETAEAPEDSINIEYGPGENDENWQNN
jgi:hypothetical protein